MRYFEDATIGEEQGSAIEYEVTVEELKQMSARWDPQPFHLDENAPQTREYGGLITCSAHTFAIFTYLTSRNPVKTAAIAGLGFDEIRMLRPVRPGDRIRAFSTCLEKRESRSRHRHLSHRAPQPPRRRRLHGPRDRDDPQAPGCGLTSKPAETGLDDFPMPFPPLCPLRPAEPRPALGRGTCGTELRQGSRSHDLRFPNAASGPLPSRERGRPGRVCE